jgi:hypothetical protein
MTTKRKWQICPECDGEGKVVHPACSVWTADDRAEDPDGFEEMLQGTYDVICATCHGSGKVQRDDLRKRKNQLESCRLRGMESGDPEMYYNPNLGRY